MLAQHGGPVMGTPETPGAVTVTPIFWSPPGSDGFSASYQTLVAQFSTDLAAASGADDNFLSTIGQYSTADGKKMSYLVQAGTPIVDSTAPAPKGSIVNNVSTTRCRPDLRPIIGIGRGAYSYTSCVTDTQVAAEVSTVLAKNNLPSDPAHLYAVFLPKRVESCLTRYLCELHTGNRRESSYCAYHSHIANSVPDTGTLYTVQPYPVEGSKPRNRFNGEWCGQSALLFMSQHPGVINIGAKLTNQSPNGDLAFDSASTYYGHEIAESITDPYGDAWATWNLEVGDPCELDYPPVQGTDGAEYDQTINGHHYLTQEMWSNFADACAISLPDVLPVLTPTLESVRVVSPATATSGAVVSVKVVAPADAPIVGAPLGTVVISDSSNGSCTAPLTPPAGISSLQGFRVDNATAVCTMSDVGTTPLSYSAEYGGDDFYNAASIGG